MIEEDAVLIGNKAAVEVAVAVTALGLCGLCGAVWSQAITANEHDVRLSRCESDIAAMPPEWLRRQVEEMRDEVKHLADQLAKHREESR